MIKGDEVGEVKEIIGADRTQDRTLDLRVRSVVNQWRGLSLDDQTLEALMIGLGGGASSQRWRTLTLANLVRREDRTLPCVRSQLI